MLTLCQSGVSTAQTPYFFWGQPPTNVESFRTNQPPTSCHTLFSGNMSHVNDFLVYFILLNIVNIKKLLNWRLWHLIYSLLNIFLFVSLFKHGSLIVLITFCILGVWKCMLSNVYLFMTPIYICLTVSKAFTLIY